MAGGDGDTHVSASLQLFREGLAGGKPPPGEVGSQPEWFYKGDGRCLMTTGTPLTMPDFALDGGEEPEIAGVYVIDPKGNPCRIGFVLANEFSDHVMESASYLYIAASKLRQCAVSPALLVGDLPDKVEGRTRIRRGKDILWESSFRTGEMHMTHSLANLEHHHFRHEQFRRPGDLHLHLFGTAIFSFGAGVETKEGDVFEIEAQPFGPPLVNELRRAARSSWAMRQL
jgi:hypothetical protein